MVFHLMVVIVLNSALSTASISVSQGCQSSSIGQSALWTAALPFTGSGGAILNAAP
jgi:hypothetical protein